MKCDEIISEESSTIFKWFCVQVSTKKKEIFERFEFPFHFINYQNFNTISALILLSIAGPNAHNLMAIIIHENNEMKFGNPDWGYPFP